MARTRPTLAQIDGDGTAAALNVGVGANNVVQLNGSAQLPAVDASLLTSLTKTQVGLASVENTALSTWAGSSNITTLGTVTTGVWTGTTIAVTKGGTGATDSATARTNLGLGTMATATAADYLLKSGGTMTGALTALTGDNYGLKFSGGGTIEEYSNNMVLSSPYTGFVFYSPQTATNVLTTDNTSINAYLNVTLSSSKYIGWSGTGCSLSGANALGLNAYTTFDFATTGGTTRNVASITNTGAFYSYGAYSSAGANYVRAALSCATTTVTLAAETGGTGADDIDLILTPAGAGFVRPGTIKTGDFFVKHATYDGGVRAESCTGGSGVALTISDYSDASKYKLFVDNSGVFGVQTDDNTVTLQINTQGVISVPRIIATSPEYAFAPGFTLDGTNGYESGMFLPAANTVGFCTTRTERMRIDASGNVGIGATSPTNLLSLDGDAARTIWMERRSTASTGYDLTVQAGGALAGETDTAGGDLYLLPGVSTGSAESGVRIQGCVAGATGTSDLSMSTMIQVLGDKLGFYGATPIVQSSALTTALTTLTFTAPGTPNYALQDVTDTSPFGFADADEARTFISVVENLQVRVNELETILSNLGITP